MECIEDAYHDVCSVFTKLCPRLVPSPLWGISLASLARADSRVVCGVAHGHIDGDRAVVNEFRKWWFSLPRDRCRVCGSQATDIDEDWRYRVKNNVGIAVLEGLVPLCEKCHLARHLGYALVHDRGKEALEHLARVNGVNIEVAKRVAKRVFKMHATLSRIEKWRIVLKEFTGLPKDVTEVVENILNLMADNGYSFDGYWLRYYAREEQRRWLEGEALAESEEFLHRALGIRGKSLSEIVNAIRENLLVRLSVVRELEKILDRYNIKVLRRETEIALRGIGKTETTGKWMVFVPSGLRGIVLRRIVDELKKRGLDYSAKTVGVEGPDRDEQPVIVYVPSFLAINIIRKIAEVVLEALEEFGIDKLVMLKPDIFTYAGIYSNTVTRMKPYIYMTSLRLKSSVAA